jgi:hypothetical protein
LRLRGYNNIMDKDFSKIEDFVFDPSFREWVLNNHDPNSPFWSNWVANNPQKTALFNYAKAIVVALSVNHRPLSDAEMHREIQGVLKQSNESPLSRMQEADSRRAVLTRKAPVKRAYRWLAGIAATLILIAILLFFLL